MADLNVTKSQAIDQCNKLISKIDKANGDICCANGGVLGVLRVLKQPNDTVLEEQTNLTIGAEMLCEQINRDYETVFNAAGELEELVAHALDQTGIDAPHDKQSNRTKQLEKALAGVATLLSSAHEALESIQGTLNTKQQAVFISEIIQRLRPELAAFLDEAAEEPRGLLGREKAS